MANKKELQKATIKFRKENPRLYYKYSALISYMADYIRQTGATEVTAGRNDNGIYAYANM